MGTPVTKIRDLKPGMRHVEIVGKVKSKEVIMRSPKMLAKAIINDDTGEIVLNLWRGQAEQVSVGDTIRVLNGFVKMWRGKLELSTWRDVEKVK